MDSKTLIVKLLHGKHVRAFNFFQKLNVYARASIISDDPSKKLGRDQQHRTPTVKECDGDPEWKHEVRFDLSEISLRDCGHIFLRVDLFHEGVMFGDKHIGEVRVPLADLAEAEQGGGVVRFVSYQVKNPEGKPNGVLTFSYRVCGRDEKDDAAAAGTAPGPIVGGYPVVNPPPHGGWGEVGASASENRPSSPGIQYPVIDFRSESDETYPAVVPRESYYPSPESYYPQPPPPPPPPFAHGACYYPPRPPPFGPWQHDPYAGGHRFGGGWRGGPWERERSLSYWNGR